MTTRPAAADFRHAAAREHDLSGRQREVLALVARGLTNGEIADALSMTLDGAKWNVSEILSKLGFSSREEAADYWRWRQRPVTRVARWARAAIPAFGWKWVAGGGAAAVAAGGIAAGALLWAGEEHVEGPGGPFALEARIVVTGPAMASQPFPGGNPDPIETTESILRWQWADNRHYRYHIEQDSSATPVNRTFEVVADGSYQWTHDLGEPAYRRDPLPDLPAGSPAWLPISIMLGPASEDSIEELVALLYSIVADRGGEPFARVAGTDRYLGRDMEILEFGPAWQSHRSDSATGEEVTESGGAVRLWVEPDSMFIFRYEVPREGQFEGVVAEVTSLDRSPDFDGDTFVFTPPPGKTLREGTPEDGGDDIAISEAVAAPDATGQPVWPGYYAITSLPAGFKVDGYSARDSGRLVIVVLTRSSGTTGYVRVTQSASSSSGSASSTDQAVSLGDGRAATMSLEGGPIRLWWDDGDVFVEIESNTFTPAEVVEFAGSLEKR